MKKKIIVFMIIASVFCMAAVKSKTISSIQRGQTGAGEVKTATIDVNATYSGQESFGGKIGQSISLNGYLQEVWLETTGTDANGLTLTIKGHTTGLTYFSVTGMQGGKFYAIPVPVQDANMNPPFGVPIDEVIDANWTSNRFTEATIGIEFKSARE